MATKKKAEYWQNEGDMIRCVLCPHHCRLREGQWGRCHVRAVQEGQLVAASYGRVSAAQIDPIEKKPLYHFNPGSQVFSVGGWGCNFGCDFCQNWSISQMFDASDGTATPEAILSAVRRARSRHIAYTYNEPMVNYEFVRDCSRIMHAGGIRNILVTNGFVEVEPADELLALTDAANIDIKSMDEEFYRSRCRGRLEPVLRFARRARDAGCHVEITHLMVEEASPGTDEIARLTDWIAGNLGADVPLHLSAYHPQYRSETPATAPERLLAAHAEAVKRLQFVYLGNVRTAVGRDTNCPQCGRTWVQRGEGYDGVKVCGVSAGCCAGCGIQAALRQDE